MSVLQRNFLVQRAKILSGPTCRDVACYFL